MRHTVAKWSNFKSGVEMKQQFETAQPYGKNNLSFSTRWPCIISWPQTLLCWFFFQRARRLRESHIKYFLKYPIYTKILSCFFKKASHLYTGIPYLTHWKRIIVIHRFKIGMEYSISLNHLWFIPKLRRKRKHKFVRLIKQIKRGNKWYKIRHKIGQIQ